MLNGSGSDTGSEESEGKNKPDKRYITNSEIALSHVEWCRLHDPNAPITSRVGELSPLPDCEKKAFNDFLESKGFPSIDWKDTHDNSALAEEIKNKMEKDPSYVTAISYNLANLCGAFFVKSKS